MTRPIQRRAARVLLVDERGRVLLFRGFDPGRPQAGTWWFTPGGGVEGDESSEEAARRELFEETGFRVAEMGAVVLRRHVDHEFEGRLYSQEEEFFWVGCGAFPVSERGWTPTERQ
ncbi:MAG TPA: NUDIX domain-containing protein, partial [Candidatus Dormibacteraeota bacterium]